MLGGLGGHRATRTRLACFSWRPKPSCRSYLRGPGAQTRPPKAACARECASTGCATVIEESTNTTGRVDGVVRPSPCEGPREWLHASRCRVRHRQAWHFRSDRTATQRLRCHVLTESRSDSFARVPRRVKRVRWHCYQSGSPDCRETEVNLGPISRPYKRRLSPSHFGATALCSMPIFRSVLQFFATVHCELLSDARRPLVRHGIVVRFGIADR